MTIITGTLHEDRYTFLIISLSVLLGMGNISEKTCRESKKIYILFSIPFFPENLAVYESHTDYRHTHTKTEYVTLLTLVQQQMLFEPTPNATFVRTVSFSPFWNCLFPRHRAVGSVIYLTSPSFKPRRAFLVTCLPCNLGFWWNISKFSPGSVFPNSLLAYPKGDMAESLYQRQGLC